MTRPIRHRFVAVVAGIGVLVLAMAPAALKAGSRPVRDSRAPASSRFIDAHECRPGERPADAAAVIRLVRSVVAAFNAGNVAEMDRLVAAEPAFKWFSATGPDRRFGREAEDRSTLGAYIRSRHRHHDHLTLIDFGTTNAQGRLNLLILRRHADDYRPRNPAPGKQSAICRGSKARLIVWSM